MFADHGLMEITLPEEDGIEAEVNPLIIKPDGEGVVAVDGRIIRYPIGHPPIPEDLSIRRS